MAAAGYFAALRVRPTDMPQTATKRPGEVVAVTGLNRVGVSRADPWLRPLTLAPSVLLVGVPGDLEKVAVGIGEVPGVDAERAHMGGCGQRAACGFDLSEQLVDLCLRLGGNTQAELG